MATPYQLPSSFAGGMQGAVESLKRGQLPQSVMSPVIKPQGVKQTSKRKTYEIEFGNGVVMEFDRMPNQQELEELGQIAQNYKKPLSGIEKTAKGVSDFMQAPGTNIASSIKQTAGEMFKGVTQPVVGLAKGVYKGITDVADIADLSMEKAPEDRGIIQKTLANLGTGVKDLATRDIQAFQEAPGVKTGLNIFNPVSEKKVGSVARVVNRGLSDFFGSAMETALTPEAQQTVATTLAPIGALFEKVLSVVPEGDKRDTAEALLNLLPLKVPGAKNLATGAKTAGAKGMSVLDTIRTSPVIKPLENVFSTSTTKNKVPKSVTKNLDVIQTIKTGVTGNKVLKQAKNRGFDPELDIATYEDLKPTITNDGRVNTDVAQENLQNFIEPYQEKLDNAIAQEGEFVPSNIFRKEILKELESEKSNIRNYEGWVNTANNAVDTAVRNFGDSNGNIPLSEVNNIKKKLGSNNNYLDPNITLDKTIARAAKQIVEDYTKSADVKALNKDLARWYTTREYLQILGSGTKTVKGGRLGKYAARLAGVLIGNKLGPIGGVIGGEVASKIQSSLMKGALKNTKQEMPTMDKFLNIKKKQQLLLPPPSGIAPSGNVVDVKPMTGYSPGVLNKNNNAISRQTSSNTTVSPQSQSPLEQVLEGKRKKPVIPVKKESKESLPGKKVNTPIIPKKKKSIDEYNNIQKIIQEASKYKSAEEFIKAMKSKVWSADILETAKGVFGGKSVKEIENILRGIFENKKMPEVKNIITKRKLNKNPAIKGKYIDDIPF